MLLAMRSIEKTYPGVRALRGVDLTLNRGEVLALIGENGAGKSTLMKVLGGAVAPDGGSIEIDGRPVALRTPGDSQRAGVAVIYQEFNLIPGLSAAANLFLGREATNGGFIKLGQERRQAVELFQRLGVEIDPDRPCRELSVAQQQIVEIAKALSLDARVLVMDEPSAALTAHEVERLFGVIRDLKSRGLGIIYISHRLDELFEIADRVTVLRDGANVGDLAWAAGTQSSKARAAARVQLIEKMVGRPLTEEFPKRSVVPGEPRLSVRGLSRAPAVNDVSLDIRRGEVLALTGLVGAGRTETARLIFGADRRDAGEIRLDGKLLRIRNPRDAIRAGIGFLTEDRKLQGLVLNHSVRENFGLPNLRQFSTAGFVSAGRERQAFNGYAQQLKIRVPNSETSAGNLSGGNQQKVVLAKWLARRCDVLIFDEPTRGIDVGAKYEIYLLINELAAQGKSILLISSELPEVLGMADRILVMHAGRITGEFADIATTTQEAILEKAMA